MYTMTADLYHKLSCMQEDEARAAGLWPDGCPSWDEAFVEVPDVGWREVWDIARQRPADDVIEVDVGPSGRTYAVPAAALVRVR